jgi:hypothetical protein
MKSEPIEYDCRGLCGCHIVSWLPPRPSGLCLTCQFIADIADPIEREQLARLLLREATVVEGDDPIVRIVDRLEAP